MKLYEIKEEYERAFENMVDPETGEITKIEELEAIEVAFDEKIDNIASFIKTLEADAAAIKAEKMALGKRQASKENQAKWLRHYLETNLCGQTFENAHHKISYRKSKSVEVDLSTFLNNEDADLYLNYKDPEPNKTAIKKALDDGIELIGAQVVEKANMQLK